MAAVTALAPAGLGLVKRASGAASVGAAKVSGDALGNQTTGWIAALCAVGMLALAVVAASRKQKRDADVERRQVAADARAPLERKIEELKQEHREQLTALTEQLHRAQARRDHYFDLLIARGVPPPPPPGGDDE